MAVYSLNEVQDLILAMKKGATRDELNRAAKYTIIIMDAKKKDADIEKEAEPLHIDELFEKYMK